MLFRIRTPIRKKAVTYMTIPRGRILPGILCISALFAVSCGTDSGAHSQPDIVELSTERATLPATATTVTTALTTETETAAESTAQSTAAETTTVSTVSASVTSGSTAASGSASATTTVTSGFMTLPLQTWWTPLPITSTTTLTTSTVSGLTVTAPEAWQTTAAQTAPQQDGYQLSASDQKFLESCVFVGDSICSGLKVYKILPASRVVAKGSVGARNIFDFKFTVGKYETDVVSAVKSQNPKHVIFSMGMNDINMTTQKQFCTNYQNLLTAVQKALPNAQLHVASITPIAGDCKFSTNTKIDKYNASLKTFLDKYPGWTYVDITKELKNQWNGLKAGYSGGDGIHLSPTAYQAILWQVCKQLNK